MIRHFCGSLKNVSGEVWKIAEIRLKQLEKSFEVSKNRHPVLRQFSTDLDTEKITVILGRSGCGKTTLLRILAGLERLDGGEILFERQEKLGVVFQEPRLMPWLTLEQNVLFGADKKKYSGDQLKEKAASLLKLTGLEKFGKAYPDQLSGGMMQRAALARALACDASYLLMDEPFAALDHFTRQTMQKEFLRICAEEKMGALFVTHSVDEALLLGNEILIMENGKVGSRLSIPAKVAYPRDLLSEEMIGIKREIIKTLENKSGMQNV